MEVNYNVNIYNICFDLNSTRNSSCDITGSTDDVIDSNETVTSCTGANVTKHILIGFVVVLGLLGNGILFMVISFKGKKTVMNLLLKFLALVDSLFLIAFLTTHLLLTFNLHGIWLGKVKLLSRMVQLLSVWLLVLIASVRYMAVCHPLSAKIYCSPLRIKIAIAVLISLNVILHIPQFNLPQSAPNPFPWNNDIFIMIYYSIIYLICLFFLIPFILLLVLNIRLMLTLKRREVFEAGEASGSISSNSSRRNHKDLKDVTRVVVAIVTVYLVTYLPFVFLGILQILESSIDEFTLEMILPEKCLEKWVKIVVALLLCVNSSVNFLVYICFGKSFRKMFTEVLSVRYTTTTTSVDV